ncbi:MAG: histidine kinase dimerization/phospho-acceptor domain-containing protein [Gammaproteobacteria bacterium]
MRTPLLIALALIVLLPVGALGWLGLRLMASEQQALEHRVQTLVDAQLSAIDETLAGYFAAREAEFIAAAADLPQETEALRRYIQHAAPVRQVFIMDAQGERVHPPRNAPLTESEQRFLERSADIWRDKDIIYQGGGAAPAPAAPTANPAPPSVSSAARPSAPIKAEGTRTRGWYVWHWGAETDLIFWRRDAQGELLGFELEPAQVMADLIALLPATGGADDRLGDARVQLIDDRGTVVYQWGGFQPDPAQHALAVRPLGHPLGSWKLSYYAPALAAGQGARWLTLVSALTALALAVGGLALYLYREHTREMRIAHQRVNFVNQVSHELKTPLTNIRMYAELLADQIDEAEDKPRRYIDIIVAESQRLSRLILNVLNFARLQRQRLGLRRQPGMSIKWWAPPWKRSARRWRARASPSISARARART